MSTVDPAKAKQSAAALALKRSETARRRRNQTEKKLEDEKTETINRLLKKQVGKRSTRDMNQKQMLLEDQEEEEEEEGDESRGGTATPGGEKRRRFAAGEEILTREERKNLPRGMYRTIVRVEGTTVSIPLQVGQEADGGGVYKQKWNTAFGQGLTAGGRIQVLEPVVAEATAAT